MFCLQIHADSQWHSAGAYMFVDWLPDIDQCTELAKGKDGEAKSKDKPTPKPKPNPKGSVTVTTLIATTSHFLFALR